MPFRFAVGDRVRVLTHPGRPLAEVTGRWPGAVFDDHYGENVYAVSGFVTRQRESSLAGEGFVALPLNTLEDWRMAGSGRFHLAGPSTVESEGGPGILWYPRREFRDFVLAVSWRLSSLEDNSGVFLRIPPLGRDDPARDWKPAVTNGLEVQIDDRGFDPERGATGSDRHRTGALYGRAPASAVASCPIGEWNVFHVTAQGPVVCVALNGVEVSRLEDAPDSAGYLGLQTHHAGSHVQFRALHVRPL